MGRKKQVNLTDKDKVAIMTNDPAISDNLSVGKIEFGDKTYELVDLPYDDYMRFISLLQPFLEAMVSKFTANNNVLNVGELLIACGDAIPELAHISLKQVDPTITIEKIKQIGKTPFRIAPVVLKQIAKNQMIKDISDFFAQILPLMKLQG